MGYYSFSVEATGFSDCENRNVEPEQPYKGTFNVRISPELHRNIAIYAIEHGKSLNAAVEEAIGNMVRVSLEKR